MRKQFAEKYHSYINEALYVHLKGYMIGLAKEGIPLKNIFPEYPYYWLKLKKWLTLQGYKDMYYFIRNFF